MAAQDIIIRPVITERSMAGIGMKKYTFEVAKDANKIEIAKVVEELFDVKVSKVNTCTLEVIYAVKVEAKAILQHGKKQSFL